MAISDLIERGNVPHKVCATCHHLATLPPDKAEKLRAALANTAVRYRELQTELATDPEFLLDIDSDTLSRHARGICGAREKLR